ncbi:MAG TPA: pilus assembly protein PilP [Polyangiales bacterium]|jgi:type IV pilus assembly protein PilP|nr:pilus assembly protein PilP [Polyangiales bacterium]
MFSKMPMFTCLLLTALAIGAGCGGDEELGGPRGLGSGTGGKTKKDAAAAPDKAAPAKTDLGPIVYTDEDFVELDIQNRDPFRSYAKAFKAQAAAPAQRRVLMPSTSLDEMRLIAIVTGITTPRAMLTDTTQVGHVVRRGDYVGRPEVVQTGGSEGMPVTLNWRVDRIRPGSVVLTREDPTSPDKPPLTRVMPLHEGGEPTQLTASP